MLSWCPGTLFKKGGTFSWPLLEPLILRSLTVEFMFNFLFDYFSHHCRREKQWDKEDILNTQGLKVEK